MPHAMIAVACILQSNAMAGCKHCPRAIVPKSLQKRLSKMQHFWSQKQSDRKSFFWKLWSLKVLHLLIHFRCYRRGRGRFWSLPAHSAFGKPAQLGPIRSKVTAAFVGRVSAVDGTLGGLSAALFELTWAKSSARLALCGWGTLNGFWMLRIFWWPARKPSSCFALCSIKCNCSTGILLSRHFLDRQ